MKMVITIESMSPDHADDDYDLYDVEDIVLESAPSRYRDSLILKVGSKVILMSASDLISAAKAITGE